MAATETAERRRVAASYGEARLTRGDETKNALKTTEFFAMVGINRGDLDRRVGVRLARRRARLDARRRRRDRLHDQPRAREVRLA